MENKSSKILLWLVPIFFGTITFMFIGNLFIVNRHINKIKEENREYFESIKEKKNYGPFQIDYVHLDSNWVAIDPKEIDKINNHIKVLSEEVINESNRTERVLDYDIDRLNNYLALSIAFMTLLGIFAPILINILSAQDLRDKLNTIGDDLDSLKAKDIDKAIKNANDALGLSKEASDKSKELEPLSQKINDIEKTAKENLPDICNLILQNAVFRFFNVSSYILSEALRNRDFREFVKLLENIKNGFERCKNENEFKINSNPNFLLIIEDFIRFLNSERFSGHPIFNERQDYIVFDRLITELAKLHASTNEKKEENITSVNLQILEVINQFNKKYVANQPVA